MKIYNNISSFNQVDKPIVTTGTFDGVHFGHRKIIDRLNQTAQKFGGESVLLTFSPHPRMVLFPDDHGVQLLNTMEEKIHLLENAGIQHLIIQPFTIDFSRTSSVSFVRDIIVNQLNTYKLVIGYNHHFGRNREGSFEHLKEFAPLYGFEVEEIPVQLLDDVGVSSTKIRRALLNGNVQQANDYLGYNYSLNGTVVQGRQIGRTIGFPTLNIEVKEANKLIPKNGVYAVQMMHADKLIYGMMNIGNNPTISNDTSIKIEVHLFNFNYDLYNCDVEIQLLSFFRDEIQFNNLEELKTQLDQDKFHIKNLTQKNSAL